MAPLTDAQKALVESSIQIARRAAYNASRRQPAHEHQIMSAAQLGLMIAAENYERLGVKMPWRDWAAVHANRAICDYFRSKFGRRFRREMRGSPDEGTWDTPDPKSLNDVQAVDVDDLLSKIPSYRHALLARSVVFDQTSRREAEEDAGFSHASGSAAWDKVVTHLKVWGDM